MNIKYSWSPTKADPNEVTSIEVKSEAVPRCGELVELSFRIDDDEWVNKSGRVKDVIWSVSIKPYVTVLLGA